MIGKTRQDRADATAQNSQRAGAEVGQGCGILRHLPAPGAYDHRRYIPPVELADWVEHFWVERWRFDAMAPQTREVLPHPNVQLVFAANRSRIYGAQLGRFVRQLAGEDRIFGVKFHVGAFQPFLRKPLSSIANTAIRATELFADAAYVESEILACPHDEGMVRTATHFLTTKLPSRHPHADRARRIVEGIADDSEIMRVEHLVARWNIHERTLQRLFDRYVGASPRWVIKRYRIYEALDSVAVGGAAAGADLAQQLGYFDQAHFINDFKKLVGCSPREYAGPMQP